MVGAGKDAERVARLLEKDGHDVRQLFRMVEAIHPETHPEEEILLLFHEGTPRSAIRFFRSFDAIAPGMGRILLTLPPEPDDLRALINQSGVDRLLEPPFTPSRVRKALEDVGNTMENRRASLMRLDPGRNEVIALLRTQAELEGRMKERASQLSKANRELRKALQEIEKKNKSLIELNHSLKIQSTTDPLTGLYNRREFLTRIRQEWGRYHRYSRPLSLIMLDIDHFKKINDQNGHECGDVVLRDLGRLILRNKRAQDLCCRYGGEEFIVLLTETSLETSFHVAEGLRLLVADQTFKYKGRKIEVRVSLGVSGAIEQNPKDVDAFINLADTSMYAAKRHGRNKTVVIDPKRPKTIIRQSPGRSTRGGNRAASRATETP